MELCSRKTGFKVPPFMTPIFFDKRYIQSFLKLRNRLGSSVHAPRVLAQVEEVLLSYKTGAEISTSVTSSGETRLPRCFKYGLSGAHRLVLQRIDDGVVARFVGTHEEVDRFLDRNRGAAPNIVSDGETLRLVDTAVSPTAADAEEMLATTASEEADPYLDDDLREHCRRIGLSDDLIETIDELLAVHGADEAKLARRLSSLSFPTEEVKVAVLDAVRHLLKGEPDQAGQRLALENARQEGRVRSKPGSFAEALRHGAGGTDFYADGTLDPEAIERLVSAENFQDWLLFLHPDQQKIVDANFNGPARLLGVAGSGKTCVLVHRAFRLAREHPGEKVLVLTYNKSLSHLLKYLLSAMAMPELEEHIEVLSVEAYLRNLVRACDPERHATLRETDPKSGENIETCWADFIEKPHALPSMSGIVKAIGNFEERPPKPASYLYDELAWIRSGFAKADRGSYLQSERAGRGIPLPRSTDGGWDKAGLSPAGFPKRTREFVLRLLDNFEEFMRVGEITDREDVTSVAHEYREQARDHADQQHRFILVDEYQDLSTLELEVLLSAADRGPNGLFLVGDPVQKIFARHHEMSRLGLDFKGRSRMLKKNFRNTRRVLEAAQALIKPYLRADAESRAPIAAGEVTPPDYAVVEGDTPSTFGVDTVEDQLRLVCSLLAMSAGDETHSIAVVSHNDLTLRRLKHVLRSMKFRSQFLGPGVDFRRGGVKLGRIDDVKGFEFSTVILLDASDPKGKEIPGYPSEAVPWAERWRDVMRLYVALTRARDNFHIVYVNNPSILLRGIWDLVREEEDPAGWFRDLDPAWDRTIGEAIEMRTRETPHVPPPRRPKPPEIHAPKGSGPRAIVLHELRQQHRLLSGPQSFIGLRRFINDTLKNAGLQPRVAQNVIHALQKDHAVEVYHVNNPRSEHPTAAIRLL